MSATRNVRVFRAYDGVSLKGIALSEDDLRRAVPELTEPGWSVESSVESLPIVSGTVIDWTEHGGTGGDHCHWQCPFCGETHHTDIDVHAEQNPALWFCERGVSNGRCLVHWKHERDAPPLEQ